MSAEIKFVNLMDIDITLETLDGVLMTLKSPPIKQPLPKVSHEIIKIDHIGGMPYEVRFKSRVKHLPDPEENTVYLVSGMISEVAERNDVLTPSEVGALKDKNNKIRAYKKLVRYTRGKTERI